MTTINTVILDIMGALQSLHATIPTVQAPQPNAYPTMIATTGGQPFAMTWPSQGEGWQKGAGYAQTIMTFQVLVFIDPVAQSDIPSHAVDGAGLIQQFWNLYLCSRLSPLFDPNPYQATIYSGPDGSHISHGGLVADLAFGGTAWIGFRFHVPVRAQWDLP